MKVFSSAYLKTQVPRRHPKLPFMLVCNSPIDIFTYKGGWLHVFGCPDSMQMGWGSQATTAIFVRESKQFVIVVLRLQVKNMQLESDGILVI